VLELFTAWSELQPPKTPQTWMAARVSQRARVARTPEGGAAVLVSVNEPQAATSPFRLRTSHITYTPSRALSIRAGDDVETGDFAVLECGESDPELVRRFLRVAATLPLDGAANALDEAVQQIFELFRSFTRRGTHAIQGIWAEVLLVAKGQAPSYLVSAWHSDSSELHDFVGDGHEFEVKSSTRGVREHEFSLDQLERAPKTTTVGSLLLEEDDAGATLFELLDELKARLEAPELVRRAEIIVGKALGDSWQDAEEVRYSVPRALASLVFYKANDIPRPPGPIPAAVSGVCFRADLSGIEATTPLSCQLLASLPAAA
jgi:hypothetical protein